ncbi:MAG: hypothetical protein IKP23_04210 [Elusimicrobiaceae bacterium]|nr:hypothetical protein [Elusimicrobiaceae bacterium]
MNPLEALLPQTKTIKIMGRDIEIKPISIKNAVLLGRLLGQIYGEIKALKDNQNILAKIFEIAGTNKTKEILNLLTNNAFKDVLCPEDKITLQELSILTKTLSEVNDFALIMANFSQALKVKKN